MDFDNFPLTRDLIYLAAAFTGLAFGFFLSLLKKNSAAGSTNPYVSAALFMLSGTLICITAALLVSRGRVLTAFPLVLPSALIVLLCALAAFFPRAFAFPLFLAAGLLMVWLAFSFLRFPLIKRSVPLAHVRYEGSRNHSFRFSGQEEAVKGLNEGSPLVIEGVYITCNPLYPVIGGETRGMITGIDNDGKRVYSAAFPSGPVLNRFYDYLQSGGKEGRFGIRRENRLDQALAAGLWAPEIPLIFDAEGFHSLDSSLPTDP
ncbi:MAG: hypothetical protein LBL64_07165 [Treponema sp.]|jgi:hypothetical protein|nr:hypothetical protein [Treponema sp.]